MFEVVLWILLGMAVLGWIGLALSYFLDYEDQKVASRWDICPYCFSKINPGDRMLSGPKGYGHLGCVSLAA